MPSILLVDDSKTMLMSLHMLLSKCGYQAVTATGGPEALAQLDGGLRPDLIITDLNMPEMNGIELIRALRTRSDARFTPILMLTTESQLSKRQEAKAAGATGWLVKPVQPQSLVGVLKKVLPAA